MTVFKNFKFTPCEAWKVKYTVADNGILRCKETASPEQRVSYISSVVGFKPEFKQLSCLSYQRWVFMFSADGIEPTYCDIYFFENEMTTTGRSDIFQFLFQSDYKRQI